MAVRVATFNANNLFSRWSFQLDLPRAVADRALATLRTDPGAADELAGGAATPGEPVGHPDVVKVRLDDGSELTGVLRTFQGRLVQGKDPKARAWLARRVAAVDADVLCLQEVEDQNAVDVFCRDDLRPLGAEYPYRVVVEGNDPRRIDVAVCAKLPITRASSWRFWPDRQGRPVFGRDLLQVEVRAPDGKPLRIFVNHLKSNFVANEFRLTAEEVAAERAAIARRRTAQAEAIAAILRHQRLTRRIVMVGDMNDEPTSPTLAALAGAGLIERVTDASTVAGPSRTGKPVSDRFADLHPAMWTHRHRAKGVTHFGLYDHIWTSDDLPVAATHVMRRTQLTGDGTDHDPAYVDLDL
ncbi:endonuclease/exonuclease/phosphatase family protein [Solwaraspora sp. WMMD1047]|uniref:endonuclease/exonuclease/phosphatase family protein n=1 Tax=Solwaraspora sp. WMMD1047 TaxID=3016102 RepID=UPI0024160BEE|nr:endonuclease/exonuclease/phosphatase family protein [Solwaraspora sp. WMMD1047]MDG4830808.1 endonuclease/exonuclease/phosphatase family protein [Solwaraspora sp. WMMD1047]